MSHFTVLVIGEDPEGQLAPYHEYECTGVNDQYVQDIDQTEEVQKQIDEDGLEEGLDYFGLSKYVDSEDKVDKENEHKFGYAIVKDGKLVKAVNRTNPNAKWDWYSIGGRWTGFFKLKETAKEFAVGRPGIMTAPARAGYADMAYKKDIDIEGMRQEARERARERYEAARAILGDLPQPKSWKEYLAEYDAGNIDIDKAREEYHNQPANKAFKNSGDFSYIFDDPSDYYVSLETYMEEAATGVIQTFAVVKDGQWYEKGEMGWWAVVINEKDEEEWERQFAQLLSEVSDDTLLTLVDCHI